MDALTSRLRRRWPRADSVEAIPWIIGALICVNVLARVQLEAPQLRILELTMCRAHYALADPSVIDEAGYVEERLCKGVEVQTQLATFRGWYVALDNVLGLIAAVPYLYFGQTWDRRILIFFECVAWFSGALFTYSVCYFYNVFNINMIYFATLGSLFGGSPTIAVSFLNAILAESVSATSLSKILFYNSAALFLTGVIGLSIAGTMMQYSLALPVITGLAGFFFTLPLISLVPEPRNRKAAVDGFVPISQDAPPGTELEAEAEPVVEDTSSTDTTLAGFDEEEEGGPLPVPLKLPLSPTDSLPEKMRKVVISSFDLVQSFVSECRTATFCLAIFALARAGFGVMGYLPQWASKVHDWTLADLVYVNAYAQVVGGLVMFLLPSTVRLLRHCGGLAPMAADLAVARASILACAAGALLIGLSWSKPAFLFALGVFKVSSGFADALQAYAAAVTPKQHITTFFVGVSIVGIAASIVLEPLWAGVMNLGYESNGSYDGGPFYLSALLFGVVAVLMLRLSV